MSHEQFVEFYQNWLPTKPDLEKELNGIGNDQASFAATAVKLGTSNGFKFNEDDVRKVMGASQAKFMQSKGELSETDLAQATGGASVQLSASHFAVDIGRITASPIIRPGVGVGDYAMCCW